MIGITVEYEREEDRAAHEAHIRKILDSIPVRPTWIEPPSEIKGEVKTMWATMKVLKTNNGYNGVIQNDSERGLFSAGEVIFNRQFYPFPKGTLMNVTVSISAKGRRMVKNVTADGVAPHTVAPKVRAERKPKKDALTSTVETVVTVIKETAPVAARKKSAADSYYVSPEARLAFNTALGMSNGKPDKAVKIMMVGQSGYGKTTLPKLFAELVGKSFLRMNCATIRDPEEWFGYREARAGDTVFIRTEFIKAMEKGNLVVVLDEFNRLEPWLHNTLFPLLDDDGCTVVHDEEFRIGEGVIVVGTINTGYKFTGTFELDEALLNRFDFTVEVGAMPHHDEVRVLTSRTSIERDSATSIVKLANTLRQSEIICSTRSTINVAAMHCAGMTLREAFETAVVRRIPEDNAGANLRKKALDLVNVALGVLAKRDLDNDVFASPNVSKPKITKVADVTATEEGTGQLRIVMRRDTGKEWLPIHAATWLRKLPVKEGNLGFSVVQNIVRSLGEGREEVVLLEEADIVGFALEDIAAGLQSSGITGTITRK
jgi:MoxR-like ATPase